MKKKIVRIVTWFNGLNFGTGLQAYALKHKLIDLDYDARILYVHRNCKYDWHYYCWLIERSIGLNQLRHKIIDTYIKPIHHLPRDITSDSWIKKYIHPETIYTRFGMRRAIKNTQCFISGSDSIWNTYLGYDPELFLQFATGGKKIAYSSSIGGDHINPIYADRIKKHLADFSHIGVREISGKRALTQLTGRKDIVQVMDPVFLLTKEEWDQILMETNPKKIYPLHEPYIIFYLLGKSPDYQKQVDIVLKKTGIKKVLFLQAWENQDLTLRSIPRIDDYAPLQFLDALKHASYICTDSFHCTAFSIIYEKQFVEFTRFKDSDPASANSRVYDLLEKFNLLGRIYSRPQTTWMNPIDFTAATAILDSERKRCLSYLIDSIEN